jgi:DnaJ like chaperone protein
VSISDTRIHQLEVELIEKMARAMGISSDDFRSVKNMFIPETDSSYRILEIDPSSPDKEVKKAYRKMAMKYHPDKVGHLGDSIRKGADEKFKKVNEAYERIKRERNMV